MIRAARLRHRLSFFEDVKAKDETGALVPSEREIFCCWGELKPATQTSSETSSQGREVTENTFDVTIRHRERFKPSLKIRFDGLSYEISSSPVDKDGRRRFLNMRVRLIA